ncbi:MAG: peptidase C39 family protein [Candidatus Woesearchaeota archaeon]
MPQTTRFTTAASGLMYIINHFNKDFIISKENEFKIWHSSVNLPTRASSIYGLASFALSQGLKNIKIIVGNHEYNFPNYRFRGYKKEEIDNARFSSFIHQKKAREQGIEIEERDFDFEELKDYLKQDKFLLVRLNKQAFYGYKPEANYFAVFGYDEENKEFTMIDPQKGETKVKEDTMHQAFETLRTKSHRDNRMIVIG